MSEQKQISKTPLFPLDSAAAEVIFAPFHDCMISPSLPVSFEPLHAIGCRIDYFWCWTNLSWETCEADRHAASFSLKTDIDVAHYDNLIVCITMPPEVSVSFESEIDHVWRPIGSEVKGTGIRLEIILPIEGNKISGIKLIFKAHSPHFLIIHLSWFGLQKSALAIEILESRLRYDPIWTGLVKPVSEWGEVYFEKGLLFDESDLEKLRTKRSLPGWDEHYLFLEARAAEYLSRCPEDDLSDYLPINDLRYIRERESGKTPYYFEALLLGFVGLVNQDQGMMTHALRYLMCMLHTRHWTQSAESRLRGSTWDQRCFYEEMTTTSVSLLADWYSFALTDRAKDLIRQSIWDKGLAIIERDMMKFDYVYHMNQGAVFCRARILGGLLLEGSWPHIGNYVERAFSAMSETLENYFEKDGGVHEGIGYFCQTLQAVILASIVYCRRRGKNLKRFLKKHFSKCENYVSTMSGCIPGTALAYSDCRTEYFCGDVIPIMAGIFPGSIYEKILASCIKSKSIFFVTGTLSKSGGIAGLIYGPDKVIQSERIVPTFSILKKTGCLTSFRESNGHSTRVHLCGSRANPSHTHFDKGSLILEMDDIQILIDRGMIEYWYSDTDLMMRSSMHNVITPLLKDGTYPDQDVPSKPVIPFGRGNKRRLKAGIDLQNVWQKYMNRCTRKVESESPHEIMIIDEGELKKLGKVAFHLHSTIPFKIELGNKKARLRTERLDLEIFAEWAEEMLHRPDSVNLNHETVYHLILHSHTCKDFKLKTMIVRE